VTGLEERLVGAGLTPAEARRKGELFAAVETAFLTLGAEPGEMLRWFVPGRIEVLGKHTDYAGGRSLLCAVGRGFCVAASPRGDRVVRVVDVGRRMEGQVVLDPDLAPASGGWHVYLETVAGRVARNFPGALRGADIVLASDLPRASGLSSSSALVVALFTVLARVNALEARAEYAENIGTPEDLGGYLGCLENGRAFGTLRGEAGVGTFGGSEDHTAILCSRAGEIAQYAFCPVRRERTIPFPRDWAFVVASSGVAADKTGGAKDRYNRLSLSAAAILELWNRSARRQDPNLLAAVTGLSGASERIRDLLRVLPVEGFASDFLVGRFDQFVEESTAIVPAVADWLARGEVVPIGQLVDRSQELAEKLLGNQIPETVLLASEARSLGAAAASAFGGGFGGSVWALVRAEEAEPFRKRWGDRYAAAFPNPTERSRFFTTRPGPSVVDCSSGARRADESRELG
jgi:galactokinase